MSGSRPRIHPQCAFGHCVKSRRRAVGVVHVRETWRQFYEKTPLLPSLSREKKNVICGGRGENEQHFGGPEERWSSTERSSSEEEGLLKGGFKGEGVREEGALKGGFEWGVLVEMFFLCRPCVTRYN